jgi:hypothetical protein
MYAPYLCPMRSTDPLILSLGIMFGEKYRSLN